MCCHLSLTSCSLPAQVASKALEKNLTKLGPLVLPISEQLQFAANLLQRKVLGKRMAPYVPNFAKAFDHFCLHAGAPSSIYALFRDRPLPVSPKAGPNVKASAKQLGLEEGVDEPSFHDVLSSTLVLREALWLSLACLGLQAAGL